MDLMEFDPSQKLYFEEELSDEVNELINTSSELGGCAEAEAPLLQARELAPTSYSVLVALYRYYYFTHRYADALVIGDAAMALAAKELNWPSDWRDLSPELMFQSGESSVPTVRFHLFALKGTSYLALRLGEAVEAKERLDKLMALDVEDVLGGKGLAPYVNQAYADFTMTTAKNQSPTPAIA